MKYLFLGVFLCHFLSLNSQSQADLGVPITSDLHDLNILNVMNGLQVKTLGIGVIKDGQIEKVEVFGELPNGDKAGLNSVFKVASLTKPVFALTVLKLIDAGIIGLDEPLHRFWVDADVQNDERHKLLTPRLLLSHQSGFPNWRYQTPTNQLQFNFTPGSQCQYSGEGFEYLRRAIEAKTKRRIEELTEEYLFVPASMRNTKFHWGQGMKESNYVGNYNAEGQAYPLDKHREANAAANMLSTVEDYLKFSEYVLNGAELSRALYSEMIRSQISARPEESAGLGWMIKEGLSDDEYALVHTGKDPGVGTLVVLFPESKNGYVILSNSDNAFPLFQKLLPTMYNGMEVMGR